MTYCFCSWQTSLVTLISSSHTTFHNDYTASKSMHVKSQPVPARNFPFVLPRRELLQSSECIHKFKQPPPYSYGISRRLDICGAAMHDRLCVTNCGFINNILQMSLSLIPQELRHTVPYLLLYHTCFWALFSF